MRALSCHFTKHRVSKRMRAQVAGVCTELEQTERETEKEGAHGSALD